jgi:DNA processing protein
MISAFDLLALSQVPHVGARRLYSLVSHFGGTTAILDASPREIAAAEGFSRRLASSIAQFMRQKSMAAPRAYAEAQLSRLNKVNGSIVSIWEERYPESLKSIYDPPPFFFACGEYNPADRFAVAVVGTRLPSREGIAVAEELSGELARRGITVVSGLARGIDTIAHGAALKSGGRTMAAIGSGLDVVYPPENRTLFRRIAGRGLVLSEYRMGTKPDAINFPRRNRIISGLALGTVVIETGLNGGAMITANLALDQNREVFAVPGSPRNSRSRGCNALIREGRAKLVECVDDVLVELGSKLPAGLTVGSVRERTSLPDLTLFEKKIYDLLAVEPSHIDSLAELSRLAMPDVLVNLLSLEFKGLVKQLPGKLFLKL